MARLKQKVEYLKCSEVPKFVKVLSFNFVLLFILSFIFLFLQSLHILMTILKAVTYLKVYFIFLRRLEQVQGLHQAAFYFLSVSPNVHYLMYWTYVQHRTFTPQGYRWSRPRLFSMFLFAFSIFTWCCYCCWQIRYHTASMPPEAYWHSGAVHRFSNRLELFQFCSWQIWTDMLPPLFPGCNNSERLIYKTCSTINS